MTKLFRLSLLKSKQF